jgi:hypothetical protein
LEYFNITLANPLPWGYPPSSKQHTINAKDVILELMRAAK